MKDKSAISTDQTGSARAVQTAAADSSLDTGQNWLTDTADLLDSQPRRRSPLTDTHRWVWFQFIFFGIQLTLDLGAIMGGFLVAYWLRRKIGLGGTFVDFQPTNYLAVIGLSTGALLVAFYNRGLYRLKRGYSKIDEFYRICAATLLGLILAVFLNSCLLGPSFQYSRIILVYSFGSIILLTSLVRLVFGWLVSLVRRLGVAQVRILIVGNGDTATRIVRRVQATPDLGYSIVGLVQAGPGDQAETEGGEANVPTLGGLDELAQIVQREQVDELIITVAGVTQDELYNLIARCDDLPVNVRIYPEAFQLITTNEVTISPLTGLPLISVKDVALRGLNRVIKRLMDVVISAIILVLASPIMLFVALMIKLSEPRAPVFFTQERVGLDGKPFTILKFRSMRAVPQASEPGWTTTNDPRRTVLGRFIRRFSIDELPQFINVLVGDMSIVGPRPEQIKFVEQFSQRIPRYMRRHKEKAGVTGWAQVNGLRGDTSITERTRYDLYYVENWSVLFDLKIILKTVLVIFTDKNAY